MNRSPRCRRHAIASASLAVVGLAAGVVQAQVLDIPLKWTYKGAVYLRSSTPDNNCQSVYVVPAGQTLRLTDFMLANDGSTARPLPHQSVCTGASGCSVALTAYITAPAGSTLVNNTTTGYRVDAGQTLYTCNDGGAGDYAAWSFSGYLYTNP